MKVRIGIFAFAAIVAAGCAKDSPLSPGTRVALGDWGGFHADLNAIATATVVLVGCTSGSFPANVPLDPSGRFTVNGTWNGSTGPILLNNNMPAQMSGQVIGNSLTFAIAVNDTTNKQVSSIGPVTVVFGRQATGQVCPL